MSKAALADRERACYPLVVNAALCHHTFGHNVATMSDFLTK
jgi:hypothetical protein